MSERLQHLHQWPWEDLDYHHVRNDPSLTSMTMGGPSLPPGWKGLCVSVSSRLITSPWKEPRSEVHRASLWSIQTSLWLAAWSIHRLSAHPSQHTRASLLLSTSYKNASDINKKNSSFQKKHTTTQIVEQVATYFSSAVLSTMQNYILPN